QRDAAFVRVGDPATIRVPERPGQTIAAKVSRTTGQLDARTRTLLVEVDCDNRRGLILPGSFVQVTLRGRSPALVELPAEALVLRAQQPFVAVLDGEDRVRYRSVSVADDDGVRVRLLSGVEPGDRVAIGLGDSVAEGTKAQPVLVGAPPS